MARDAGNKKGDDVSFKSLLARLDESADRARPTPSERTGPPESPAPSASPASPSQPAASTPSPERPIGRESAVGPERRRQGGLAPANDLLRTPGQIVQAPPSPLPAGPPHGQTIPGLPIAGMPGHGLPGHGPVSQNIALAPIAYAPPTLQAPPLALHHPATPPANGSRLILWASIAVGLTVSASLAMLASMWYARQIGSIETVAAPSATAPSTLGTSPQPSVRTGAPEPIRPISDADLPATSVPPPAVKSPPQPSFSRDMAIAAKPDTGARLVVGEPSQIRDAGAGTDAPPVPLVAGDPRSANRAAQPEPEAARSIQLPSRRLVSESAPSSTEPPAAAPRPSTPAMAAPPAREAKLLVAPTLRARAGEITLYAAKIEAPGLAFDKLKVVVSGLPSGAALSAGSAAGEGTWHVPARAIEQLSLRLPASTGDGFALALELQDGEGHSLARASTVVVALAPPAPPPAPSPPATVATPPAAIPGSSPPVAVAPAAPTSPRLSMDDDTALIERGRLLARNGDIAGARLMFERAADTGSGRAALLLGETYDPDVLAGMGVLGARGDVAKARRWYTKASELGMQQAAERLKGLVGR